MAKRQQTTPSVTAEDPVQLGTGLLISWTGTATRRLVVAWPSGTVTYPVSGPGQRTILAKELGTVPISTRANGLTIAQTTAVVQEAPVDVVVVIPEPPPPPPTAPQVIAATPLPGATGRAVTVNGVATFDMDMDAATITGTSMTISPSVANAVSYDAATRKATLNPTGDLVTGTEYTVTLSTAVTNNVGTPLANPYSWSFTTEGVAPGPSPSIVGWAAVTPTGAVTGGTGGTLYQPTTWAQFKAALQQTGPRIVQVPAGTPNFDAGGNDAFNVDNDDITIDGSLWHGSIRGHDIQIKCDNWIISEMRLRPGDDYSAPNDQDGLTINPGSGNLLVGGWIDHCSILWALDMGVAALNHVTYLTVSNSIIGAGLRQSAKPDNPKGLGMNISVPNNNIANEATEHGDRITRYRNFFPHNFERNLKAERATLVESLNEVFYNWGDQVGHGNPRSINVLQNYYKKGTNTTTSRVWEFDPSPAGGYANSVYFPFASSVFKNQNGTTTFTPNGDHVGTSAERGTPNASSGLTPATMTDALAAQIVEAAGPTFTDNVDRQLKDDFANGTGVFYNGLGFPAPNPTYP